MYKCIEILTSFIKCCFFFAFDYFKTEACRGQRIVLQITTNKVAKWNLCEKFSSFSHFFITVEMYIRTKLSLSAFKFYV